MKGLLSREDLLKKYREIINPRNFIHEILKDYSFEEWLDLAEDIESLEGCLKSFEKEEMYEYCVIIKKKIEEWKSK